MNFLDAGGGGGWGAKEIADAVAILGTSKLAIYVLILAGIFLFGRYYVLPYMQSRKKPD